jgi:small GTP-binding protein
MQRASRGRGLPLKVVFLGDPQVGKTSIISRKLRGENPGTPHPTVGSHLSEIIVRTGDATVTMQVLDTAGQEMYRALVPHYLREAHAAILVFDITGEESFKNLSYWYALLDDRLPPTVPVFVVGNKVDLSDRAVVTAAAAAQFAEARKSRFFRVSALTGVGVSELFEAVAVSFLNRTSDSHYEALNRQPSEDVGCRC